jgi:Sec-independent protein translocase protein TatA
MELLGIGPLELLFVVIIALLLFGPKDMIKAGRTIGGFLRKIVTSEGWKDLSKSLRDLRNLPYSMMREAGMEDVVKDLREVKKATSLDESVIDSLPKNDDFKKSLQSWTQPVAQQGVEAQSENLTDNSENASPALQVENRQTVHDSADTGSQEDQV